MVVPHGSRGCPVCDLGSKTQGFKSSLGLVHPAEGFRDPFCKSLGGWGRGWFMSPNNIQLMQAKHGFSPRPPLLSFSSCWNRIPRFEQSAVNPICFSNMLCSLCCALVPHLFRHLLSLWERGHSEWEQQGHSVKTGKGRHFIEWTKRTLIHKILLRLMLKNMMHPWYFIFNKGYKMLMLLAINQSLNRRAWKKLPLWTTDFSNKLLGAFRSLLLMW